MKIFFKILLIISPLALNAQVGYIDSLHTALANAPHDSARMDINNSIGIFYAETNRDTSLYYREKALELARKLNLKVNEADIMVGQSYMLSVMGNFPKAMQLLLNAMKILEDPANEDNPFHLTEAQSALNTRMSTLSVAYFILGNLYDFAGNRPTKLWYYRKGIDISESIHDLASLGYTYASMGIDYMNHGELDSALYFEQKAISLYKNVKALSDSKYEAMAQLYLGMIFQKQGKSGDAQQAFNLSEQLSIQRNNLANLGFTYVALSELYQSRNRLDSSLYYAKKGLSVAKDVGEPLATAEAYARLSTVYDKLNIPDSSLTTLKFATALKDSVATASKKNIDIFQNMRFDEQFRIQELEKEKVITQNRNKTYAFLTGLAVLFIIGLLLYRNNRQKQKANKVLANTLSELKATQSQLIQSEKMASLGELTAGIAHEIQNPLNFVNNFSEVNKELADELKAELASDSYRNGNLQLAADIADDLKANSEKINHHGKRADAIVKGMLQHSQSGKGQKELTDINALADEYLSLSYHGLRAKDKSFNATLKTDFDSSIGKINIVSQDIGRVLLNLYNNAFYAVNEKRKMEIGKYEPIVLVSTKKEGSNIIITVIDNGNGIPKEIVDKIFQPFFTTKPTGQGTGLGLSLSYDIVKAHGGEISAGSSGKAETKKDDGTEFIIRLPVSSNIS